MITIKDSIIEDLIRETHIDKPDYPYVQFPSAYLATMSVSDFLMLTTYSHQEANQIIKDISDERYRANPGDTFARWSQERADSQGIAGIATLAIDDTGQIHMHDGRHRAVIAVQSKLREIPVVIRCTDNGNELQGLHSFCEIKDQYHKGERKTVPFMKINPVVLVEDNREFLVERYSRAIEGKIAQLAP